MISAFVGYVFCDVSRLWSEGARYVSTTDKISGETQVTEYTATSGLVPVFVMITSAVLMCLCGVLINKLKWKWLNDYALPICMVLGMVSAIPLTALFGGEI